MYLIIQQGMQPFKVKEVTALDLEKSNNGDIFLLDITDPNNPKEYYYNEWSPVEDR